MKHKRWVVLLPVMLLVACNVTLTGSTPLLVIHLTITSGSFASETMLVVREQQQWQSVWSEMNANGPFPPPPLPTVDFAKDMVLVAAAGTRPTGGYGISITKAAESAGGIEVGVTMTSPGSSCVVTQTLTSPVDIATIPRSEGNVQFAITREVHNCP